MTDSWRPSSFIPLRLLTQRLASTPDWQLPHIAPILAGYVSDCRTAGLAPSSETKSRNTADDSVLFHKLKTQLSALLQDRSANSKYAAIVLIKALIESAGHAILHDTIPWVRNLIGILKRPGRIGTKRLIIITLTRIFLLTQSQPSLIREVTTPSLPDFLTTCLNITKSSQGLVSHRFAIAPLTNTIVQAFTALIPYHPAVFRPFSAQLQILLSPLVAPTIPIDSSKNESLLISPSFSADARRLFVLLHLTAPKNSSGEAWTSALRQTLSSLRRTADLVFRAVVEDSQQGNARPNVNPLTIISQNEEVADINPEPLPLPAWSGIYAGMRRLNGLLQLIQTFISTKTSTTVNFPLSEVVAALDRLVSVTAPRNDKDGRIRLEIGRDERESLFNALPNLHVSTLEVLSNLIIRFGHDCTSVSSGILSQVFWIFENEKFSTQIRLVSYNILADILAFTGMSTPRKEMRSISSALQSCCGDLYPLSEADQHAILDASLNATSTPNGRQPSSNTLKTLTEEIDLHREVQKAAEQLLAAALWKLPNLFLDTQLRVQIDRIAIVIQSRDLMLASAMNPAMPGGKGQAKPSVLPLLARDFPAFPEVEALIRPQMPVLLVDYPPMENGRSEMIHDHASPDTDLPVMESPHSQNLHKLNGITKSPASHELPSSTAGAAGTDENLPIPQSPPLTIQPFKTSSKEPPVTNPFTRKRDRSIEVEVEGDKPGNVQPNGEAKKRQRYEDVQNEGFVTTTPLHIENMQTAQAPIAVPADEKADVIVDASIDPHSELHSSHPSELLPDSDESDFEIPPLNVGLEVTDGEEEGYEEGEEEEDDEHSDAV